MAMGLLGRKIGMTRIFTDAGNAIPVSVVEVLPNRVTQIKNIASDRYNSVQLVGGTRKASRINKPMSGHFAKAGIEPGDMISEFRVDATDQYENGQIMSIGDVFQEGNFVDVSAVSKGKGFAGVIKRHNFSTQDATHGNSLSHRAPGSIGQNQTPGRVFKGKKMAGHMGNVRCTIQSLELVKIDSSRNLLLIKGSIPGAPGTRIEVRPSIKKQQRGL